MELHWNWDFSDFSIIFIIFGKWEIDKTKIWGINLLFVPHKFLRRAFLNTALVPEEFFYSERARSVYTSKVRGQLPSYREINFNWKYLKNGRKVLRNFKQSSKRVTVSGSLKRVSMSFTVLLKSLKTFKQILKKEPEPVLSKSGRVLRIWNKSTKVLYKSWTVELS